MSVNDYENLKGEPTALIALAGGKSYRQAAEISGVHLRTIGRRMEDAQYRRRVQDIRSEMLEQASGQLAVAATMAVETLTGLLKARNPNKSSWERHGRFSIVLVAIGNWWK